MASGISIPIRIQNEIAAGLDVASADLKKFADTAVATTTKQADALRMLAKQYGETAAQAKAGSQEQTTALKLQADAEKKLAVTTGELNDKQRATASGFSTVGTKAEEAKGKLAGLMGSVKSLAFTFGGLGAAFGGYDLFKTGITNAEDLERAQNSLKTSIDRLGGSYKQVAPDIQKWATDQRQFGVSMIDAEQGFARLIPLTGSARTAMQSYHLALILSKGDNIALSAAETAVAKAMDGKSTSLTRYGIVLQANATQEQVATAISGRFGGQAAANTTSMDKMRASLSNIETTLGSALLPTFQRWAQAIADWLDKSNNQKRILDAVKGAISDLGQVIKFVTGLIKGVDGVTGSFKHTLELLLALGVVAKISAWTGAFTKLIGAGAAGEGIAGAEGAASGLKATLLALGGGEVTGALATLGSSLAAVATEIAPLAAAAFVLYKILTTDPRRKVTPAGTSVVGGPKDEFRTKDGKVVYRIGNQWYETTTSIGGRGGVNTTQKITEKQAVALGAVPTNHSDGGAGPHGNLGGIKGAGIVNTARWAANQPGASTSYKWGGIPGIGKGTHTDCSGFTQAVYAQNGVSIPRTSQAQYSSAKSHPAKNDLRPGDLVFFDYEGPHSHVGIYIGGGMMIADQHTGSGIVTTGVDWAHYDGAARYAKTPPVTSGSGSGSGWGGTAKGSHAAAIAAAAKARAKAASAAASKAGQVSKGILGESGKATNQLHLAEAGGNLVAIVGDEKHLLSVLEAEASQIRQHMKASSGKAKLAYEDAMKRLQKQVASVQAEVVKSLEKLYKAGQAAAQGLLTKVEQAVDAQFQKKIDGLQKKLDALQQQAQAQSDAQAISDAQEALNQALMLGDPSQIKAAQKSLTDAQNQSTQDKLQNQINAISQSESDFNTQIEALANKVGDGAKTLGPLSDLLKKYGINAGSLLDPANGSSLMGELKKAIGGPDGTIALFKELNKLLKELGTGAHVGAGDTYKKVHHVGVHVAHGHHGGHHTHVPHVHSRGKLGHPPKGRHLFASRGPKPTALVHTGTGTGGGVTVNVHIERAIGADLKKAAHEMAAETRRELLRIQGRNGWLGFNPPRSHVTISGVDHPVKFVS